MTRFKSSAVSMDLMGNVYRVHPEGQADRGLEMTDSGEVRLGENLALGDAGRDVAKERGSLHATSAEIAKKLKAESIVLKGEAQDTNNGLLADTTGSFVSGVPMYMLNEPVNIPFVLDYNETRIRRANTDGFLFVECKPIYMYQINIHESEISYINDMHFRRGDMPFLWVSTWERQEKQSTIPENFDVFHTFFLNANQILDTAFLMGSGNTLIAPVRSEHRFMVNIDLDIPIVRNFLNKETISKMIRIRWFPLGLSGRSSYLLVSKNAKKPRLESVRRKLGED